MRLIRLLRHQSCCYSMLPTLASGQITVPMSQIASRMCALLSSGSGAAIGSLYQTAQQCKHSYDAACFSTSTSQEPNTGTQQTSTGKPSNKIVVFGGRGFVGSHILQEAIHQGLHVVSVSRSGTPPAKKEPWTYEVEWVRGNALDPRSYEKVLEGSMAAISAVGAFGTQEQMLQLNGTANVRAIETAAAAGVPRFVYISAHIPNVPGIELLLRGYVQGKRQAEEALQQHFPSSGVVIRPSVIYGNRVVSSSTTLPLQYVFKPLETLLSRAPARQLSAIPFLGAALTPPVDVHVVAKAAVRAATDSSVPAGIIDIWDLPQYK